MINSRSILLSDQVRVQFFQIRFTHLTQFYHITFVYTCPYDFKININLHANLFVLSSSQSKFYISTEIWIVIRNLLPLPLPLSLPLPLLLPLPRHHRHHIKRLKHVLFIIYLSFLIFFYNIYVYLLFYRKKFLYG